MNIDIKTSQAVKTMAQGGAKLAKIRAMLVNSLEPGLKVEQLEQKARALIKQAGGEPNFCLAKDYPYSICVSINDEIVHGMPKDKVIEPGDLVGIDVGMLYKGWHLDTATTKGISKITKRDQQLLDITRQALNLAIEMAKPGIKLGEISFAIQQFAQKHGFCVLTNLTGHGIGRNLHEDPKVPNFGSPSDGPVLEEGMVLAIEPMVSKGDCKTVLGDDKWTIKLANGAKGAHFEHTVAITARGAKVLTQ